MMLGDPGGVEAKPFRRLDLCRGAGVHAVMGVGLFLRIGVGGEEDAEFHDHFPGRFCPAV
ncbi:hypothetical protein GCM10011504_12390 [Siccirubricoccus deserti]|nr:hypothetical protein GCM10011504_12390 [Siccirubricoccus deserti]